jgi:hypothetical protein
MVTPLPSRSVPSCMSTISPDTPDRRRAFLSICREKGNFSQETTLNPGTRCKSKCRTCITQARPGIHVSGKHARQEPSESLVQISFTEIIPRLRAQMSQGSDLESAGYLSDGSPARLHDQMGCFLDDLGQEARFPCGNLLSLHFVMTCKAQTRRPSSVPAAARALKSLLPFKKLGLILRVSRGLGMKPDICAQIPLADPCLSLPQNLRRRPAPDLLEQGFECQLNHMVDPET